MFKIMQANISFLPEIYQLETALFASGAFGLDSIKDELTNPNRLYFVAQKHDGEFAGYVGINLLPDQSAEIMKIGVAKPYQKQGVGKKLLLEACSQLKLRGVNSVSLEVRVGNVAARALYEKIGFSKLSLRKNYYENGEDAAVFLKKL